MGHSRSELSRFIASGTATRYHRPCTRRRGDKPTRAKECTTETVIRKGDVLLNSIQRLSKVLY